MNNIELSFRNESIFMSINNILSLTDKDWFLSDILKAHLNNFNDNKIMINEDKNIALSLIETIRYNKIVLLDNIDINLMLLLSQKWRVPDSTINLIKSEINKNKGNLYNSESILNHLIFQCINCKIGFKLHENKKTSCICHPQSFNHVSRRFDCCGRDSSSKPCSKGYHCLSNFDIEKIIQLSKKKIEIN